MPVIRGQSRATALTADHRNALLERLKSELAGKATPDGPLIFEIPLEYSDSIDILVVWQAFEGIRSEDRSGLILEAYNEQQGRIAQALGVTYEEAMEQQLLPYAVVPMVRPGDGDPAELREAMLAEGGIRRPGERVDLRFPTMAMAQAAQQRLCERLPGGYWSISQTIASVP
jgi:hypothetical protein